MPTFSYQCGKCQQVFDLILKVGQNDQPLSEPCPYCKETTVRQIVTTAAPVADPYTLGLHHLPDGWRAILNRIKEKNPGANINLT